MGHTAIVILLFFILLTLNGIGEEIKKHSKEMKKQNNLSLILEWRRDLREKLLDLYHMEKSVSIEMSEIRKVMKEIETDFDREKLVQELNYRISRIWKEMGGKGIVLIQGDELVKAY